MTSFGTYDDVSVDIEDLIATVEIQRPPYNFFDVNLIQTLAQVYADLDDEPSCRAIVLASDGKAFCAGAQLTSGSTASPSAGPRGSGHLYEEAVRLFSAQTPVVAAVQGAAVGGGLGLAMSADFRIACPEARFTSNFARLGFHQGFGLTVTLPAAIGQQKALEMLYTGRRVKGEEALDIGLCDYLVPIDELRAKAKEVALEIAYSAPLAIRSIHETMRGDLPQRIKIATDRELAEQDRLRLTNDFHEGIKAMGERRKPNFQGN